MRFSDLAGKELIDLRDGLRLGELGDADLVFEARTGKIQAIVIAPRGRWWERPREWVIPWRGIRKIGVDLIIVDLGVPLEGALPASWDDGGDGLEEPVPPDSGGGPLDYGHDPPSRDRGRGSRFFFRRAY